MIGTDALAGMPTRTASHRLDRIGLLERENAAPRHAALADAATSTR